MPPASWLALWRKDFTVPGLIDLFKDEPMQFKPGERFEYDNSGYIKLGAILERASGQGYADFIRQRIFEPLGMKHSYYGADDPIIPGRVAGYKKAGHGFVNAAYLSMTQPYAAGSLLSSVDDLALWDAALFYRVTSDRIRFLRDAKGETTAMVVTRRYGGNEVTPKVTSELPKEQ